MQSFCKTLFIIFFISFVRGSSDHEYNYKYNDNENPWYPIFGPYGDKIKPLKKEPKTEDNKLYFQNNALKPYLQVPYTGLYTFPYYAFGEVSPVYQTQIYGYPDNMNYLVKKENKEKPYYDQGYPIGDRNKK